MDQQILKQELELYHINFFLDKGLDVSRTTLQPAKRLSAFSVEKFNPADIKEDILNQYLDGMKAIILSKGEFQRQYSDVKIKFSDPNNQWAFSLEFTN